jgi:putative ABC transport system permease protein
MGVRLGFIWLVGVRDLQWRRRRFVMAALATSLVFAITLLLAGTARSFSVEVDRVVDSVGADGFVVQLSQKGPFMSPQPFDATIVDTVRATKGVTAAAPVVSIVQPEMYLFGFAFPGDNPASGRAFVDARLNRRVDDRLRVGASELDVSRVTHGRTVLGGQPLVQTTVADAQKAVFGGNNLITSVAVRGKPASLPLGYKFVSRNTAADDFLRPIDVVMRTIALLSFLLWVVAAAIVGSVVYVSTLERVRDISVFKATGAATRDILAALVVQAVLLSLGAAVVAIALAYAISPAFPMPVTFAGELLLMIPGVGALIGLVASAAGLRRAVRVDPALAMGG